MQKTRPGEFIALVAAMTAMMAMSIDTMLPAIGDMARELGATHVNDRHLIILLFFAGQGVGTLLYGPLSDSVGRKPSIYAGLVVYAIGCLMCFWAQSFPWLILGRFVQGFGASGPRVVALAMVRDGAKGAEMARIMSYVMSVFMLVPVLAPSIGQLVLNVATWRMIFLGFLVLAAINAAWLALRQPETLARDNRLAFSPAALWKSAKEVVRHPVSFGYTLAVGFIFASFNVYLATSQQIFAEQYQQGKYFALWFGGLAIGIAMSMILNGRYVRQLGMRRISGLAMKAYFIVWCLMLLASLLTGGHPPLPVVGVLLFCSFFLSGMIFGNYNAMSMEPMGHIAGMAAAISGFISSMMAITLGGFAARQYDGTMFPISVSFVIFSLLSLAASTWAERNRPVG